MADRPSNAMSARRIGILAAVAALTAPGFGQDDVAEVLPTPPPEAPPPATVEPLTFSVASGFQYLFETNIDGGGEVSLARVPLQIGADWKISRRLSVSAGLRYELDLYDFSGTSPLGADPWNDVNHLYLDARIVWALDQRTRIFGGPVIAWNRESGADWGSAVSGGGLIGATYAFSKQLVVGAGMGVITEIEDNPFVYPIIILNWQFTEKTYLTSRAGPAGVAAAGVELVHRLGEGWEVGIGARYEYRRFRLDDTGVAPAGVGEETNFPAWIRLSYRFAECFNLDFYAGMAFFGRLGTDDDQGNVLARTSYDPAPTVAVIGSLSF
jgi:hypothetical protein